MDKSSVRNPDGTFSPCSVSIGTNMQIADTSAVWANSAPVNTQVNIDVPLPDALQGNALYVVVITNPSIVSALTVVVRIKETLGGNARYPEITRFGIPANTPDGKGVLVQGWMLGEAGRLTFSNDTLLGVADAFTAYVRVRKV